MSRLVKVGFFIGVKNLIITSYRSYAVARESRLNITHFLDSSDTLTILFTQLNLCTTPYSTVFIFQEINTTRESAHINPSTTNFCVYLE